MEMSSLDYSDDADTNHSITVGRTRVLTSSIFNNWVLVKKIISTDSYSPFSENGNDAELSANVMVSLRC